MNFQYSYELENAMSSLLAFGGSLVPSGIWSIAAYVLSSLGIYTVAKRRGIRNPWMAWVPVVDLYLLGCVSDQYRYVVKGKNQNKRKVLVSLAIGRAVAVLVMVVLGVILAVQAISKAAAGATEQAVLQGILPSLVGLGCVGLVLAVLALLMLIFRSIALYDLYTSCNPENNVLFLVLSLLVPVTEAFFIFFSRELDRGMPPRKDTVAQESTETSEYVEPQVEVAMDDLPELVTEEDPWDRPDTER